jgi:hypothetical protein
MSDLLSLNHLRAVQKLGEKGMNTDVLIRRKSAPAKDPSHPYGDEIIAYQTTTSESYVKGWLVPILGKNMTNSGGETVAVGDFKLRVPVGTNIDPEDEVVIDAEVYRVVDSTNEQSWPEWTTAQLRRIQ